MIQLANLIQLWLKQENVDPNNKLQIHRDWILIVGELITILVEGSLITAWTQQTSYFDEYQTFDPHNPNFFDQLRNFICRD